VKNADNVKDGTDAQDVEHAKEDVEE